MTSDGEKPKTDNLLKPYIDKAMQRAIQDLILPILPQKLLNDEWVDIHEAEKALCCSFLHQAIDYGLLRSGVEVRNQRPLLKRLLKSGQLEYECNLLASVDHKCLPEEQ